MLFSAIPQALAATINVNLPGASSSTSPGGWVENFYQFALMIAGVLAFAVVVYGGIRYMTAVGNPSGEEDAKEWIWAALTGLLLLAGAYIILNVVNPQILNLTLPTLKNVSTTSGGGIFGDNNASSTDTATWGCTASNNAIACSPGGKSDCSDVPNGACSGKLCVQTTVSKCGTTANPSTQSTCARVPNGGTTGTCPDVNGQHQSCCYFSSSNSSAFCAAVDSCDKISQTDGTCQATTNGGTAGICPDADGKHQSCCSDGDGGAYCSTDTPCPAP